ncbi:MAG TPA: DUF4097 family beta strand repeat-containing protein [Candidatus Limnocylindrales bacterium]|nr:DUF4097 family beta strand repeat-containing protein [Candidatus Limnocylindrales bacterium]
MTTTNAAGAAFEHAIGRRGRLTIRLASAELRLRGGDDDRVIIRTPDGQAFPDGLLIEPVDGGLAIREDGGLGLGFGIGRRTVELDIQMPLQGELGIDTASGWIETDGLRGEQRFKTASGEVRLRRAAGTIDLAAVSGDATIDLDGQAALSVHSVSGDVAVRGGRIDRLRVATTSGDIRVDSELSHDAEHAIETLSGDVELVADGGVRVDARTVSGDLSTDLPHRTEGRMGRRAMIVGDGATRLAFRSVSGDLRIRDRSGGAADAPGRPAMPTMPSPPAPPRAPSLPPAPGRSPDAAPVSDPASPADEERMTILRALERGELDVATAMARLAELDVDGSDA